MWEKRCAGALPALSEWPPCRSHHVFRYQKPIPALSCWVFMEVSLCRHDQLPRWLLGINSHLQPEGLGASFKGVVFPVTSSHPGATSVLPGVCPSVTAQGAFCVEAGSEEEAGSVCQCCRSQQLLAVCCRRSLTVLFRTAESTLLRCCPLSFGVLC